MDMNSAVPTRAESVIEEIDRMTGTGCLSCGRPLCSHAALTALVAGMKDAPPCHACLAKLLNRSLRDTLDSIIEHILRRDCFRAGWEWANRREGFAQVTRVPDCLRYEDLPGSTNSTGSLDSGMTKLSDQELDVGMMGCGELLLLLRGRLQSMASGSVLRVTARDPGAREDLPAWCRLTGHNLLSAVHPEYRIQRKAD